MQSNFPKVLMTIGLLASSLVGACGGAEPVNEIVREDLDLIVIPARISNGLSGQIKFDIPGGVDSFLMEVRGDKGRYSLAEFKLPNGRDQISGGGYLTRGAIVVPGQVDWLYPNDGSQGIASGTYSMQILGRNSSGGNINEDINVLIYTSKRKPQDTCAISLDFLVDDRALSAASIEDGKAMARIVERMDLALRQVGIKILDYQVQRVDMQAGDIDLGNGSVTQVVDDVLQQTLYSNPPAARSDAIHVMFVRRIGGTDHPTFDPLGYSMGLPGPYSPSRDTSAVMVATEKFADSGGSLDADGLASSLVHEIGHFLGLYHTSERNGAAHDPLDDTPNCSNEFSCSDEFKRNLMTSSFWLAGAPPASRNRFTDLQGNIMRGHPLCIPKQVTIVEPPIESCDLECTSPNTCAVLGGRTSCERACIPLATESCETGICSAGQLGTYVCQPE